MRDKILFLLGGYDLEMVEIKKILEENGVNFKDKHLSWGAKLSEYEEYLDFDGKIYGIELVEDIKPPANYITIDHHDKRYKQKSSLEQVAEILDLKLTRWQQLVAANDRGYIPEMRLLCATDDEIKKIRREDRIAQGVTENEEKIAELEIKNIKKVDGVYLLKTTLKHFSPLVDRTYQRPLIIHNEHTLSVFSDNIEELINSFKDEIDKHLCYYGDNPLGYFGFSEEYFKKESIDKTVKRILKIMKQIAKKLYSYHIFMFPFRFSSNKDDDRKIISKIDNLLKESGWSYKKFNITSHLDYNEFVYFHKYVTDEIYDTSDTDDKLNKTAYYYEKEQFNGTLWKYEIKDKIYQLHCDGVAIRIFKTGIGILTINLENREYEDDEDILKINDFARRVYPQFLNEKPHITRDVKSTFLPKSLEIVNIIKDDFEYSDYPNVNEKNFPPLAKYIKEIIGTSVVEELKVKHVIDDRMYTMCYINKDGREKGLNCYRYQESDFWYRYIFIDGGDITCHSSKMKKELIKNSTYDRWMDSPYGCSLFGITRYSFMIYSSYELLLTHMKTMYYQMVILALAQRASILKFSDEITDIIGKDLNSISAEKTKKLYYDYIYFINMVHFREITPQEQGIELYDILMKQMQTEKHLKELDGEIAELYNYVQMVNEDQRNDRLEFISNLGAIFLPPSLLASIYGMNSINFTQTCPLGALLNIISAAFLGACFVFKCKLKDNYLKFKNIILFILFTLLIFVPYFFSQDLNLKNESTQNKGASCLQIIKSHLP